MTQFHPSRWARSEWPEWFTRGESALEFLREETDRAFQRLAHSAKGEGYAISPRADLRETDDDIVVTVELAGFDDKNVDVSLQDNRLIVKARIDDKREEDRGTYHFCERRIGNAYRALSLPCTVDEKKVSAEMKDGVLTVTLGKTAEARATPTKITVKHAA